MEPALSLNAPGAPGGDAALEELENLLQELLRRQIFVTNRAGSLRYSGQLGALTAELRARLEARSAEVIRAISPPVFVPRGPVQHAPLPVSNVELLQKITSGVLDHFFTNGTNWVTSVEGSLDVPALMRAFQHLTEIHTILSARLEPQTARLLFGQTITPRVIDLTVEDAARSPASVRDSIEAALSDPFDLETEPLFRPFLVKIDATKHVLGLVIHHIVGDGISVFCAVVDLWRAYIAFVTGSAHALPDPPPLQYSDYAVSLNDWIQSPAFRFRRAFWKQHLKRAPQTRLKTDFPTTDASEGEVASESFALDAEFVASLARLAATLETSVFIVVLALKANALYRFLESEDIVILAMHNGRDDAMLTHVIGSFQNQLPLRLAVKSTMSFRDLVRTVHQTYLTANEFKIPYGYVAEDLRAMKASQVFAELNFIDMRILGRVQFDMPGMKMKGYERIGTADRRTLAATHPYHSMSLTLHPSGMHVAIFYFAPMFCRGTMRNFAAHFCSMAKLAVADPEQRLSDMWIG